jgi:amino acid transporter
MADAVVRDEPGQAGEKGLRSGALGMLSGIVIGVASTAPGYSLAASLGLVVAAVGLQAPAIMFLAFVPMLFIAAAYYYLNRADPDCGTTFAWVTRAMGPPRGLDGRLGHHRGRQRPAPGAPRARVSRVRPSVPST